MVTSKRSSAAIGQIVAAIRRRAILLALAVSSCFLSNSALGQVLEVSPAMDTVFRFSGFEGGTANAETLSLWTLDNTDTIDLDFSVSSNQTWLVLDPVNGSIDGVIADRRASVTASLDPTQVARLAPGVYAATVTFINLNNGEGNTTRFVQLQILPASFTVSPAFVNATWVLGSAAPTPVTVTLRNSGQPVLNYELSWLVRSWYSVDKVSGTIPAAGLDIFTISFNPGGLGAGTYTGQIDVENTTNGIGNRQLSLTLIVTPAGTGVVRIQPESDLVVRGVEGSMPNALQGYALVNGSDQSVLWSAISDENWVTISPASGTLAASNGVSGGADEQSVELRLNPAVDDLRPGSHTAAVSFQTLTTNPLTGTVNAVVFGTRIAFILIDPVLTLNLPAAGGGVEVFPPGTVVSAAPQERRVFPYGEVVTLTASANDGYQFVRWAADFDLDDEEVNPLTLAIERSRTLTPVLVPIQRTLTLSMQGTGTGTLITNPSGDFVDNELIARYNNGSEVTVEAEADAGSVFTGWTGNVPAEMGQSNPLFLTMDRDRAISARFERFVTLEVETTDGGSVVIDPAANSYAPGTVVTLTATADPEFEFEGWSGDAGGTNPEITLTLSRDMTALATFSAEGNSNDGTPTLTVDIEGDGTVTPAGGDFSLGEEVLLVATPALNGEFLRWEGDTAGTDLTTTVTMNGDRTVRAVFSTVADDPSSRPVTGNGPLCGTVGTLGVPLTFLGLLWLGGTHRKPMGRDGG